MTLSDRARRISKLANKIRAQEEQELELLLLEWDLEWEARMDWLAPSPLERELGWGWPFFWFLETASS